MSDYTFTQKSFELLEGLTENNDKAWYADHKQDFENYLREPFARILELASERLEDTETPLSGSAKTMFRQHRDIRFSKDKSPYSTHVSGLLTPSGTKSEKEGVFYLHLDATGGMMACGFYQLKATELGPIRDRILEAPQQFAQVLAALDAAGLALSEDEKLKSMPQGYKEHAEHEYADYLKLKSFVTKTALPKSVWLSDDLIAGIVSYVNSCQGLLEFCKDAE
ncbi:MAG: DUF2461 domain-containing protein [Leptolyngbyaceae cyanobacterium]